MVRLKAPLLSMGAHGTIGGSTTFQSSTRRKFARVKPDLPYSLTLPQQYQRWLYEDYVAYWHVQTALVKEWYRSSGVRFHLTAFQYFMKYHLQNLPDIALLCHLDFIGSGLTPDSSKSSTPGTVIGASVVDGLIDHALYSDGINDRVDFGVCPVILACSECSIEFFFNVASLTVDGRLFEIGINASNRFGAFLSGAQFSVYNDILNANTFIATTLNPVIGQSYHCVLNMSAGGTYVYIDGSFLISNPTPAVFSNLPSTSVLRLFCSAIALQQYSNVWLDHFCVYSRRLDPLDISRHSKRRYQP